MPAPDEVVPPEAIARFTAAEARLYPTAMTDALGYQQATALVGAVLTHLRAGSASIADVLRQRHELIARLPELARAAALTVGASPADVVVDAASAVRCRELQAAGTAARGQAQIEAARAAGDDWFVIEPDPAEVMYGTIRRSELHLPSGSTMITSIEAGRDGSGATYLIEVIGPAGEGVSAPVHSYPDLAAWTAAADDIRAALAGDG